MNRVLIFLMSSLIYHTIDAQSISGFEEVEFVTTDDIKISASYGLAKSTIPAAAIILIHQGGSSREEWFALDLVKDLLDNGFAILAYDVRTHGKSGKDQGNLTDLFGNPNRAPLDLKAALDFLKSDTRVDSTRIGILGASIGANLACVAASSDSYPVKSVVSISAKVTAIESLGTVKSPTLRNAFHIASAEEQNGLRRGWAEELYANTSGHRAVHIADGRLHGSYILRENSPLQREVLAWFKKTL
ncbi:MAG: alpha/beta fold hydrolase [Reichenbachiella sp.]|uniref:alpha/beta hydrolase n=1 Tax=Reichenbachiella sp. TaxID=2184521 RepID=UPI003263D25C